VEPSEEFPGRVKLRFNQQTNAYEMPGGVAGKTLESVGGGPTGQGTGGAPMSTDRRPGESLSDYTTRKQAEQAGRTQSAKETATANTELERNAKIVEEWLNNPQWRDAMQLLPTSVGGAAAASLGGGRAKAWMARKFPGMTGPGAGYLQLGNTKV